LLARSPRFSTHEQPRRAEQAVKDAEAQIGQISADQARIRENLAAVPAGSELQKSYLGTLADQEKKISAMIEVRDKASSDFSQARQALEKAIAAI
jgi:hypothetical protein